MSMWKPIMPVVVVTAVQCLFLGGCSGVSRQAGTGSPGDATSSTRSATADTAGKRTKAAGARPTILHLKMRDKWITVKAGPDGPVYFVKTKDGEVLADGLSAAEMRAQHPKLHGTIETLMADTPIRLPTSERRVLERR